MVCLGGEWFLGSVLLIVLLFLLLVLCISSCLFRFVMMLCVLLVLCWFGDICILSCLWCGGLLWLCFVADFLVMLCWL